MFLNENCEVISKIWAVFILILVDCICCNRFMPFFTALILYFADFLFVPTLCRTTQYLLVLKYWRLAPRCTFFWPFIRRQLSTSRPSTMPCCVTPPSLQDCKFKNEYSQLCRAWRDFQVGASQGFSFRLSVCSKPIFLVQTCGRGSKHYSRLKVRC